MSNPTVVTQFAMPDPSAAPLNLIQLFSLANVLVSSTIQGESFNTYVKQSDTPGVEDQTKVWIQLDTQGRPIALKVYWNGNWRRVYNGMTGEIRGYTGDPSTDFDANGLGKVGLTYDGWHLCNGLNGTPNMKDKFLIGGDHYDSGWETSNGFKTGGTGGIILNASNTYRPATSVIRFRHWSADGNTPQAHTGNLYGVPASPPSNTDNDDLVAADPGNLTPAGIPTLPPFIALGWIIFVGYV